MGSGFPISGSPPRQTVIEHWTGSAWATVPSPDPTSTILQSVSATSASDIWAVGDDPAGALILHYDGTGWTKSPTPPAGNDGTLWDVDGRTASDAWAAGWTGDNTTRHVLMLRWDGTNWNPSILPAAVTGDGRSWAAVTLPVRGILASDDVPESISAAAGGQAWVSGFAGFREQEPLTPLAVPVPVVPDVTGQQSSAANSNLTAFGLTGTQNQTTSCPPSVFGQVVNQNPLPGEQEPFGQAVTLTVCAAKVTVPALVGLSDSSARNAITSAGLRVGTVTLTPDCTRPRGTVLSQNPDSGTQVLFGSSVSLNEATRSGSVSQQVAPHFCTQ